MKQYCWVKFVFLHFQPYFYHIFVCELVKLSEILKTDNLVSAVREAKEEGTFSVLEAHVDYFKLH